MNNVSKLGCVLVLLWATTAAAAPASPGKPDFTGFYIGSISGPPPLVAPNGTESAPGGAPASATPFFPDDMYTRFNCIPDTAFGYNPYGEQLVMTPGRLTWINQYNHVIRRIDIDQPPPQQDLKPSFTGYSVGHWEDDTLVVATTGLLKVQVRGIPPETIVERIVEHIRLVDDGRALEREVHYLARRSDGSPVESTTRTTYTRKDDQHLYEFICEDGAGQFGEVEDAR